MTYDQSISYQLRLPPILSIMCAINLIISQTTSKEDVHDKKLNTNWHKLTSIHIKDTMCCVKLMLMNAKQCKFKHLAYSDFWWGQQSLQAMFSFRLSSISSLKHVLKDGCHDESILISAALPIWCERVKSFYVNSWKKNEFHLCSLCKFAYIQNNSHFSPLNVLTELTRVLTTSCASFSLSYVNICWCFPEQVLISCIIRNKKLSRMSLLCLESDCQH